FIVVCGSSGCGKTTLLRQMKPQLAPHGERSGEILFRGKPIGSLGERESAAKIGFVQQSPEGQIVTDKVWHELAFGLENLGCDTAVIRRRVAETASFFGIEPWFDKDTSSLSGGQKQLLNLAAVMVMQPELLLLDEPTGQLDPIAAADFLAVLKKINTELGTTVILTEHRLEEAVPLASRVAVMEDGAVISVGNAAEVGAFLKERGSGMFRAMPAAMRIWSAVESSEKCPVSVNEGRGFLERFVSAKPPQAIPKKSPRTFGGEAVTVRGAWFRYEKALPDVVRNADLRARFGELLCVLGGNGAGKTTLLKLLAGIKKPYRGEVTTNGKVCLLPQDPKLLFSKDTVYSELSDALSDSRLPKEEKQWRISDAARLCGLCGLEDRHPYDLSGGEQQRAALAKLLLLKPDILLADEPAKGLDAEHKARLAEILRGLLDEGVCVVAVSHDVEFCAEYADRCALFFDGAIAAEGEPREFFSGNCFYTTAAHRISRGIIDGAVTSADVASAIGGTLPKPPRSPEAVPVTKTGDFLESSPKIVKKTLPLWRKIGAAVLIAVAVIIGFWAGKTLDFGEMLGADGVTPLGMRKLCVYGAMILCLFAAAVMLGGNMPSAPNASSPKKRRLSKRTIAAAAAVLVLIPITLFIGVAVLPRKQYYITAAAILIECMLPFFLVFEGRKPKARELVIIAVLCALGIAGRAAFFMLPQFKPVLAVAIIAGAALGGETGFLVGAVTMLVSNIMFSQGPWTPWQMFAAGLCGALGGVVCRSGFMRRRAAMSVFGAVCAVVIYGGIVNPSSVLIWSGESLNFKIIMTYWLTGLPMDCVHAAATAIFLWFLGEPMLRKLERVWFDSNYSKQDK
ncbi:MAG: ATP-binding cassette domain-containing protein, partial [Oscillospiraceae bacterium]|nr:ATP-binding cassette domain-containing protein [Oscillospiraceae bacterium]